MSKNQINTLISRLKKVFENAFGSRIVCLIHHGSSVYKGIDNEFSDIDLELVLLKNEIKDYEIVKNIIKNSKIKIECQLRYLSEITNSQSLIANTKYKMFMYFAYSNGICLLGKNIYQDLINNLSDNEIKKSLLISAQIEFKNIRKEYLSDSSPIVINKHIKTFLLDTLMFLDVLDYRDLGKKNFFHKNKIISINQFKNIFSKWMSEDDFKIYQIIIDGYDENQTNNKMFLVVNKIYKYLLKK